jgi:hypothetical protein
MKLVVDFLERHENQGYTMQEVAEGLQEEARKKDPTNRTVIKSNVLLTIMKRGSQNHDPELSNITKKGSYFWYERKETSDAPENLEIEKIQKKHRISVNRKLRKKYI